MLVVVVEVQMLTILPEQVVLAAVGQGVRLLTLLVQQERLTLVVAVVVVEIARQGKQEALAAQVS